MAEKAILQLASMLRTILDGIRGPLWPLARELELVRTLFAPPPAARSRPLRARVGRPGPTLAECELPPMVLLPLAENAMKHGPSAGPSPAWCAVGERGRPRGAVRPREPGPPTGPVPAARVAHLRAQAPGRLRQRRAVRARRTRGVDPGDLGAAGRPHRSGAVTPPMRDYHRRRRAARAAAPDPARLGTAGRRAARRLRERGPGAGGAEDAPAGPAAARHPDARATGMDLRGARSASRGRRSSSSPPTPSTRCARSTSARSTTCSSRWTPPGCSARSRARAGCPRRARSRAAPVQRLAIETRQGIRLLDPAGITHVVLEGELPTLFTAREKLLADATLQQLQDQLAPFGFERVHRRALLHLGRVARLQPLPTGGYLAERRGRAPWNLPPGGPRAPPAPRPPQGARRRRAVEVCAQRGPCARGGLALPPRTDMQSAPANSIRQPRRRRRVAMNSMIQRVVFLAVIAESLVAHAQSKSGTAGSRRSSRARPEWQRLARSCSSEPSDPWATKAFPEYRWRLTGMADQYTAGMDYQTTRDGQPSGYITSLGAAAARSGERDPEARRREAAREADRGGGVGARRRPDR